MFISECPRFYFQFSLFRSVCCEIGRNGGFLVSLRTLARQPSFYGQRTLGCPFQTSVNLVVLLNWRALPGSTAETPWRARHTDRRPCCRLYAMVPSSPTGRDLGGGSWAGHGTASHAARQTRRLMDLHRRVQRVCFLLGICDTGEFCHFVFFCEWDQPIRGFATGYRCHL